MKTTPLQQFSTPNAFPLLEIRATLNSTLPYAEHFHSSFSLGLILAGQTRFSVGKENYLAKSGDIVLIAPWQAHSCNPVGAPRSYLMALMDAKWFHGHRNAQSPQEHRLRVTRPLLTDNELFTKAKYLLDAIRAEPADTTTTNIASAAPAHTVTTTTNIASAAPAHTVTAAIDTAATHAAFAAAHTVSAALADELTELLLRMQDRHQCFAPASEAPQGVAHLPSPIPAVMTSNMPTHMTAQALDLSLTGEYSITKLARLAGLCRESFSRSFHRTTGMAPSNYLHCLRLEYGRHLLREGCSIAQAAVAAGYVDQSHFHRMFLKYCSATPGCYRRNKSHSYKK